MGYIGGYNIMTPFEAISIIIMWISYGLFAAYQTQCPNYDHKVSFYFMYVAFAPAALIVKVLYGAFKIYKYNG